MRKRIAFFGASLVQQQNGYWKYFSGKNPSLKVHPFGYGARHLNDAGVCYIDEVIDFEPDYCIVDWFTTGYVKYNEDKLDEIKTYINTILHRFYEKRIPLLFLILPDQTCDKKDVYRKLNDYLDSLGVPTLNLSEKYNSLGEILRDGIHTTEYGSDVYANDIGQYFFENVFEKNRIPEHYPEKNKFCEIKRLKLDRIVYNELVFKGNCEVVGISQLVGPYTGILDIDGKKVNYWDRWCYYEREMVNMAFPVNGICTIKILEDDFDRSACQKNNEGGGTDWNIKKCLKLFTIFFTGTNLEVETPM